MKKKEKCAKKIWSILLCMALVMSGIMIPELQIQAEETQTVVNAKTIAGLGTSVMADPVEPGEDTTKGWEGSYVYYGNYDADGDGTAEPVKYRVLDTSTTEFGGTTMLLDCDSILYKQKFNEDGIANVGYTKANDWVGSDVRNSLTGNDFLHKDEVFTNIEKRVIAESTKAEATASDGDGFGANLIYAPLTGEKIFLLDAKEATRTTYGYRNEMLDAGERKKKYSDSVGHWWLRSAGNSELEAGYIQSNGYVMNNWVYSDYPGVSPAFNLNLSEVLFSSVVAGTAGETGAEYKLTLLDGDMTIGTNGVVTRSGRIITIPYSISGKNSGNATQVSILVLDKEYTVGNTNGAMVLDYHKLNMDSFSSNGSGTYILPDSLYRKVFGSGYHMYILAEEVNEEKETDYASEPIEIFPEWVEPYVKKINFGTTGIIDPAVSNRANDEWQGCYVWFGNYDVDEDGTADSVKYRVLDANTTDYSVDGKTQTMLLDCDSILYYMAFDETEPYSNVWENSPIYTSLNGDGFLNKDGVFTNIEKNAIAESNVSGHALTTDSGTGVDVSKSTQEKYTNYVALTGEQIFLLDVEDVSNMAYGYFFSDSDCIRRRKMNDNKEEDDWWLRSAAIYENCVGRIYPTGRIEHTRTKDAYFLPGVSPALNLKLSDVLFSSASAVRKSAAITSESDEIGKTIRTDWKLTLKDCDKQIKLTEGRSVTKASDGTITVPYTYVENENADNNEKVNQISVMITDKAYNSDEDANSQEAQILYYGALQNIKDAEGNESTVAGSTTGTGTFSRPSGLIGTMGEDYHVYLLAEHVSEGNNSDYASEPMEITTILNEVETIVIPRIDIPAAEQPLKAEITVSSVGVAEKAILTWKKNDTEVTGNAEWKTTYKAYVTLTATDGYTFMDALGDMASVVLNGQAVEAGNMTLSGNDILTVYSGEYTTETGKVTSVTAPAVPKQFANYYTQDNILSSDELNVPAKIIVEDEKQPRTEELEVKWSLANDAEYDATPTATNTFRWVVKESEYDDYIADGVVMEGTVAVRNKDYTPVTIKGNDVVVAYADVAATLNVAEYFVLDKYAGKPTYELLDTSTGKGSLVGVTLTMTTAGTYVIKVSTAVNGVYGAAEKTIIITRKVKELAVGTEKTSDDGQATYKVTTSDITNGTVTYVSPADKEQATITISDTVSIDGVKYKVTAIEKNAFKKNKYIKKVIIGNNILSIGDNAFYGCKNLTTVKFGKNVKSIGKKAFYGCSKLKSITIGKNVTKIGTKAFYGCKKLKKLTIKSTKLTAKKIGSKAFSKTPKSMKVTLPKKKFKSYKSMLIKKGVNKKVKFIK